MRISDDRYSRDRQRYELAWRLIGHEARTSTIVRWTGLSQYQVRRIFRDYGKGRGTADVYRLRGIPPHVLAFFWRSQELYSEAVVLAGLCRELDVFPAEPLANIERTFPSLERGQRLCVAYEAFKAQLPHSQITMEYAVLLVTGLAIGKEVAFGSCTECTRQIIVDRYAAHPDKCMECRSGTSHKVPTRVEAGAAIPQIETPKLPLRESPTAEMEQKRLF